MARTYQPARFPDGTPNPKYRARPSGRRGIRKNRFALGAFCAWDGEGLTIGGRHRYVLLANSRGDTSWETHGLSTRACLAQFCASARAQDRRTIHVVFGGSYDMNCWLADANPSQLARIWAGAKVRVGGYSVQYRARRSLSVHEHATNTRATLWDVWGFFQGSFVGALEKYGLPVPAHLRTMKGRRARFRASQREEITRYCLDECRLLQTLMEQVRAHLETAQLPIRRWDGAGACAASLLQREGTKDHHQTPIPGAVQSAIQHAYAGGRIELFRYGHAPDTPIYHYDIRSAYPAALRDVPSFRAGRWRHTLDPRDCPPDHFACYRVRFQFRDAIAYPFFWRASNGAIYYPREGEGWYWTPEVVAAREAMASGALQGRMALVERWAWCPADPITNDRPFQFIDPLFLQRAEWKRHKIGAEKMLKLALNSLYGKCAQHIGARHGAPPPYHCLQWAGWITSQTRAQLYRAAVAAGDHAVMVATDGIFSTAPLPSLPISEALGAWEYSEHTGATIVQSGVYWLDQPDGTTSEYSRGFDKGSLSRRGIVRAWRRGETSYAAQLTRFVTMGAVVQSINRRADWRQWRTSPRLLQLTPSGTKRTAASGANPARGLAPTVAAYPAALLVGDTLMSQKYLLPWVDNAVLLNEDERARRFIEWETMEEA